LARANHIVEIVVGGDRYGGAKLLFGHQRGVFRDVRDRHGTHEISAGEGRVVVDSAQIRDISATADGVLKQPLGSQLSLARMERSHGDGRLQPVANNKGLRGVTKRLQKFVPTPGRYIYPLDRHAHLAGHLKRRPQHGLHGRGAEIGIVENDRRIVTSQFKGYSLNRLGGIRHDVARMECCP
jgi:hypothetical protein